eukprot:162554_1
MGNTKSQFQDMLNDTLGNYEWFDRLFSGYIRFEVYSNTGISNKYHFGDITKGVINVIKDPKNYKFGDITNFSSNPRYTKCEHIIPLELAKICYLFLGHDFKQNYSESFDSNCCSPNVTITKNGQIVKQIKKATTSTFGTVCINSNERGIFEWKFKIKDNGSMGIGIICVPTDFDHDFTKRSKPCNSRQFVEESYSNNLYDIEFYHDNYLEAYCYHSCHGDYVETKRGTVKYGVPYGTGDVITMTLDLIDGNISYENSYYKNLGMKQQAFDISAKKAVMFRMAVFMYYKSDCIELLSYNVSYK